MSQQEASDRQLLFKGFLFAFLAVILWSGNFIVARALHQRISPVSLAFFRWFGATLLLFPFVYRQLRTGWKELLPHARYLCITALIGITIFNTLVYVAGRYTTAINMALIGTSASPVFVFLITAFILRQPLSRFQYAGISLCIAGILLLISGGNWEQLSRFHFTAGDWWILSAALAFGIYTLLVRRKPEHLSPTVFLFALFFVGTLFLFPAFLIDRAFSASIQWDAPVMGSLLYLSIGASVLAFMFWNNSIRHIGPAKTSLFGNLIPVFSSVEAAIILNEHLSPIAIASFLLILSGIIIANFSVLKGIFRP